MFFFSFGFCISGMHRRIFLKQNFDSVTFSPQNRSRAGHAQKRWLGIAEFGSRTGRDVTSGIVYSPCQFILMFLCISIQTRSFFGLFTPKMIDFVWKRMKHWHEESMIPEVTSWPVLDPDFNFQLPVIFVGRGRRGYFKVRFYSENTKESKILFRILFYIGILEIPQPKHFVFAI